jgi:hypothetical protein
MLPSRTVDITDDNAFEVVKVSPRRTFCLLLQASPEPPQQPPFEGRCFPCLLWDFEGGHTAEQRHAVVAALINHGCRYFVCGGHDASIWEDAADEAHVMMTLDAPESEREVRMVMTTAHEGESMDDVAFFFVRNTNFDAHTFTDLLVVAMGSDDTSAGRLTDAVASYV